MTPDELRPYGWDLRHAIAAQDGTVLPSWTTVSLSDPDRDYPVRGLTCRLTVLNCRRADVPEGTEVVVRTSSLCCAMGERPLGTDPSYHTDDGRCCFPEPRVQPFR